MGGFGEGTFGSGTFGDPLADEAQTNLGSYGQRAHSQASSPIQRGAELIVGAGEVRPVAPWPNAAITAGYGLWSDPNVADTTYDPFVVVEGDTADFTLLSADDTSDDATFVLLEGS